MWLNVVFEEREIQKMSHTQSFAVLNIDTPKIDKHIYFFMYLLSAIEAVSCSYLCSFGSEHSIILHKDKKAEFSIIILNFKKIASRFRSSKRSLS